MLSRISWGVNFVIALSATVFLALAPSADARWQNPTLDAFASHWSQRPVHVECSSTEEDPMLFYENLNYWSLGYVFKPTGFQNETFVWDGACLGALAIDLDVPEIDDHMKVIGFSAVLHESFHLKRVKGNEDEAITECRAMQNYDKALVSLGAEESTVNRLMPLALLEHFSFRAQVPRYNRASCHMPRRYHKYLGIGS